MTTDSIHIPVMHREVLHALDLSEGLTVMDGTVGAGGHSRLIAERIGTGRLIGFDRDPMMLNFAEQRLEGFHSFLFHASYADAPEYLMECGQPQVDRVLLDLGLSSDQLSDRERGFGFDAGGPLDMRFDTSRGRAAADLLMTAGEEELKTIFEEFGEEPFAGQIAARICQERKTVRIDRADQLESCVRMAVPSGRQATGKNPATRVFQALRIAVNNELEHVQRMMNDVLPGILKPGGIAVIITFHSLEDRIVKSAFKGKQSWQVLTRSPIEPTPAEVRLNPRSRSAKLRAARRNP
ncbi:MAG: 16S rRNA (cytosine(1402)-N(4))-methyltransferase RsmH [Planctomycetaceae bacterium]